MIRQAGFTLVELVAVLVILALLGAMAVPRFTDVMTEAETGVKDGTKNAVKTALSIAIAKKKDFPDVSELAAAVGGETPVTAAATGVQFTLNGTTYTVQTYQDPVCTAGQETTAVTDEVQCIGTVTP